MKHYFTAIMMASALALASCGDHNDEPAPGPEKPSKVPRTVLVYMVAHNDLGSRGWDAADITEMRTAASTGGLGRGRLVVMHQSSKGESVLKEITADGTVDTLKVYDTSEAAVSIARMRRVCEDVRELAPADAYGMVLWSHGTGWLDNGMPDSYNGPQRAFGLDGGKQMSVTSLAKALDGQGFDYVYFDCCHMASVEVAYELRHATPVIVGSTCELPNAGMPYDENIPMLMQGDAAGAAANTFRYYNEMAGSGRTCTMSVIRTAALDDLAEATRRVYATAAPLPAGSMPQAFERTGTCRLFDLEDYVERVATDADALAAWKDALGRSVTYAAATPAIFSTLKIARHCGLSTFVVKSAADMSDKNYYRLQWAADVAATLPWAQ